MLELSFDQSLCGGLKLAKGRRAGRGIASAVGVVVAIIDDGSGDGPTEKEQQELLRQAQQEAERQEALREQRWTETGPLEGDPGDVIGLHLGLDMGGLSDLDGDMTSRKNLWRAMLGGRGDDEKWLTEMWEKNQTTLCRLKQAAEPVRIWLCDFAPYERCGLCYVCHLLRDGNVPLSVVFLPQREVRKDGTMVEYRGSGECRTEELGRLARLERPIVTAERNAYGMQWRMLVQENAPLRSVVNGTLMSVGVDFYDFALRARIPEGEFKSAVLLGETLCGLPGIGDWWLHQRMMAMVAAGELEEVFPPEEPGSYRGQVLRKVR